MNTLKNFENLKNRLIYQFSSLFLYSFLYVFLSFVLKDTYNPILGVITLFLAIIVDIIFSNQKIRIYLRFILVFLSYLLIRIIIEFLSTLGSSLETYNLFDKIPYIIFRDSIIAFIFILFYFVFDATRLKQNGKFAYLISTIILITSFFLCLNTLNFDSDINKSIFKNYFNYGVFLLFLVVLFVFRHISYNLDLLKRKFDKKDLLLLFILFLPIIILLFSLVMKNHIEKSDGSKSNFGLFNQSLFMFDFSNFVQLKDEIKLSDDKILIMELSGVDTNSENWVNEGWAKQIYLKRYSLEEYANGQFKMAENFLDPNSPPVYISGFTWELKNIPKYKERKNILETLYLINIDGSSLMGSDLLTKVVPVIAWDKATFKQIYKSFCYVLNTNYRDLMSEDLKQDKFLKELHSKRKDLLLNYKGNKSDDKIKELAEQVTSYYEDPFYKALAIQEYLMDNYFYSLKPGLAKGGNQLEYFLFESKKGYCSYFAFAMSLMLRSVGIASRVAVGFAPDMKNSTLNFYEIRGLDAHAWVEVYFDQYGWVTFDPTSSNIAPGEHYDFSFGNKEERDKYIEEILKNKDKMKDITKKKNKEDLFEELQNRIKRSINTLIFIFIGILTLTFLLLVFFKKQKHILLFNFSNDNRKKIIYLYRYFVGKFIDFGYCRNKNESITEFADRLKTNQIDLTIITELYQKALFREQKEFDITKEQILTLKTEIETSLKKFGSKKKVLAFFNISRLWKSIIPLVLLILIPANIEGQTKKYNFETLTRYMEEAKKAIDQSFFDVALEILNEAEKEYPTSYQPNLKKGELYLNYELNENALIEFLKTKEKGFVTEKLYDDIASTYGKLGEDKEALKTFEEAYQKLYHSKNLYDNLGWMYFKVHQTNKGVAIIYEGLKKYPNSSDLLMTLGTLYSDIWDYEKSKKNYVDSISYSYTDYKSNSFRAIAYYNLSILENSFLYYENALTSSETAILLKERSSAHLELNYLYLGALNLKDAYKECIRASGLEPKTLFPEMSISYIYMLSGKLDDAIQITKQLINNKDFSWMLYFGTNKDAYYAELFKNLAQCYEFKANQLAYIEKRDFKSIFVIPAQKIYYTALNFFYNFRFSNLNIKIGEELIKGGSELEGLHKLYDGYEKTFPQEAYKILLLTEQIEGKLNPKKRHIFNIKKPIIKKQADFFYFQSQKKKDLLANIEKLDKKWEKDVELEAIYELILASSGVEKEKYIEELFLIHSPFIPMTNLKLKCNINLVEHKKIDKQKLIDTLKNKGFMYSPQARFTLEIEEIEDDYIVRIYDKKEIFKAYSFKFSFKKDFYEELGKEIFNKVFISDLD
ncbi:MAG: hypothetical protein A2086_01405 [Spirochaetes bacterium GWD1_27_9]|nr:MAG: hypothetical protein A2Z98_01865 [Spirochaetes bacterium GWB1_27_13]OHD24421.1 MAG: hypothetical protein A2Y34_04220 [Spirochaetes bacterium GWC1_27_15]OHD36932.1 MAG: hypothetical protein A2086_01405 [Spirochaetes bacterium GWD1_27_9]